ncbi:DUF1857-domain-containing protein [Rhizodiscina lignyota]|uniref:DUF1857-domain-containing protein n=1 Tax=Rhizodiscina lignyota TaxID=1504668 RepID=A0A9P4M7E6_9PEZI|nr:DUF1857-domain-containing protein [Rhizodiscina lignyota]
MVTRINLAYTGPVNPPGAKPVLSLQQVWQGLERKVRYAQEFVPVIESCKVTREEGVEVDRYVIFKPQDGAEHGKEGESVHELVRLYEPCKVDFARDDGSLVCNIVADGPAGTTEDLQMTYSFELKFPDIKEGDTKAIEEMRKKQQGMAKTAVESSIKTIREMVTDGRIK